MTARDGQHDRFVERAARITALRRRRVLAWVAGVALVLGLAYLLLLSPVLAVRSVQVVGVDAPEQKAIRGSLESSVGTPLARSDLAELTDRVEERPTVDSAEVSRDWPSSLRVDVVPRVPALAVQKNKRQVEIYDIDGNLVERARSAPKGVPTVTADGTEDVGAEGVRAALSLLESLPEEVRRTVSSVTVDPAQRVSFRAGKTTVVWGDASEPQLKVKVLSVLLEEKPQRIDVSTPRMPVTR